MSEWIKIIDKIPGESEAVLLTDGKQICIGFLSSVTKCLTQINTWTDVHNMITHWQPLPEPPIN